MDLSGQGRQVFLTPARNVKYQESKWCVLDTTAKDFSKLGESITYACTFSDCTSLGYGSSCNGLDATGNASYAFNMFFQVQKQADESCFFNGLAKVTDRNPSSGDCNFTVQIVSSGAAALMANVAAAFVVMTVAVMGILF